MKALATALLAIALVSYASANPRSFTAGASVTLSELDALPEEDTVQITFTYNDQSTPEYYTNESWGISTTTYRGVTATLQNASSTLSLTSTEATVTITRVSADSQYYTPRHELRLSFPAADIPDMTERPSLTPFIAFVSFNDRNLTQLSDGHLPASIDIDDFTSASFLIAWNRHRGDEAPLEYAGRLTTLAPAPQSPLEIHPGPELVFPTTAGQTYQVEQSTDGKTWSAVGNPIPGTGQPHTQSVSTTESPARLFRLTVISTE